MKTTETKKKDALDRPISRRSFLQAASVLAAAAGGLGVFSASSLLRADPIRTSQFDPDPLDDASGITLRNTVCLACHSACGIRCKIKDGALLRITGNPYHPNCLEPEDRLNYETTAAVNRIGKTCPKTQAYMETVYSPYRIQHPLKRVGPRGSGQWRTISWDQALDEIVNGDASLGHSGIKSYFQDDMTTDIDPTDPKIGKIANQVAFTPGRYEHGQKEFTDRYWKKGFGTINYRWDHTSICETSHHVAHEVSSSPSKSKFFPDYRNAEYILFLGTSPCEAGFPHQAIARKLVEMRAAGGKIAVVDPRLSKTAAKADRWAPVIPGTDAAFALGVARSTLDAGRYDAVFLSHTQPGQIRAADATGLYVAYDGKVEPSHTDATYLVVTDPGSSSISAGSRLLDSHVNAGGTSDFMVYSSGSVQKNTDVSTADILPGALTVTVQGGADVIVKTSFELYVERVREKTLAEYSAICGISTAVIDEIATELTSHGKKVAVHYYRGPVQHTNGVYTARALLALNLLVGNIDWKGGITTGGSHYHEMGGKSGNANRKLADVSGGRSADGVSLPRDKVGANGPRNSAGKPDYAQTAEFASNGFPARRPWFPYALHGNYQEALASIEDGYPYPIKALFLYWNAWNYSTPAAKRVAERVLTDTTKLPLFVAFDIEFGETSVLADYILPDSTILERWSSPHVAPAILTRTSGFRQPVLGKVFTGTQYVNIAEVDPATLVGYLDAGNEVWKTNPYYVPALPDTRVIEDVFIDLARHLVGGEANLLAGNFPGLGNDALKDAAGNYTVKLTTAWDWYRSILENFRDETYDPTTNPQPASLAEILEKGGRFENPGAEYSGDSFNHKFKGRLDFYVEDLALSRDSMTGDYFDPLPKYEPIKDVMDSPLNDAGFPYTLITYKDTYHSMARTVCNPTLVSIKPENYVEMNASDAAAAGITSGDKVRVTSVSESVGVVGTALATDRVRPGVVAIAHSYGHWEMGSKPHLVDGVPTAFDPGRAAGVNSNVIMRADPALGNVCLQDKIGGSASFFDTKVAVAKV